MEIENINIHSLPSLKIPERYNLPKIGAVYFVLTETGDVEYIGKAKNLHKRWRTHECCMNLDSPKTCRVAWVEVDEENKRIEFEKQFIRRFNPKNNSNFIVKPPKPKLSFVSSEKPVKDFENYLTASDVARIYSVSSVSVRSWIKKELFPNAKLEKTIAGSIWLIPENDLKDFVQPEQGRPIKKKEKQADRRK